jgi:hypothetical protein
MTNHHHFSDFMHSSSSKAAGAHPALPDPQYLKNAQDQDSLEQCIERDRAELISLARPFHYSYNFKRGGFAPTIKAHAGDGRELSMGFSNAYRAITNEAELLKTVGSEGARLFEHTTTISLKLNGVSPSEKNSIMNEIKAVLRRYRLPPTLVIKDEMRPVKWFHEERHRLFTPEQNAEIDKIAPCTVTFRRPGIHNNEDSQDF